VQTAKALASFPRRVVFRVVHLAALPGAVARWRLRREILVWRVRASAAWGRAKVELDIAPDVRVGRRVRCTVAAGTTNVVRIGTGCTIGDDVRVGLRGGQLLLGDAVDLRHHCVLGVAGRLELVGRNLIQQGCTVHCDEAVTIGHYASIAEYVSIVDSSHRLDGPNEWWIDDIHTTPVDIGAYAWICAKATITRGVRMGERSVLGANSVATKDVPAGYLASGVPASVVRAVVPVDTEPAPGQAAPGQAAPGQAAGDLAGGDRSPDHMHDQGRPDGFNGRVRLPDRALGASPTR